MSSLLCGIQCEKGHSRLARSAPHVMEVFWFIKRKFIYGLAVEMG